MSDAEAPVDGAGEGPPSKPKWGCIITLLAVFFAPGIIFVALIAIDWGDDGTHGAETDVRVLCRKSVKQQLKDPASAKFDDETITATGAGTYEMSGTVRATNSFGGTAAHTFSCITDGAGSNMVAKSRID